MEGGGNLHASGKVSKTKSEELRVQIKENILATLVERNSK